MHFESSLYVDYLWFTSPLQPVELSPRLQCILKFWIFRGCWLHVRDTIFNIMYDMNSWFRCLLNPNIILGIFLKMLWTVSRRHPFNSGSNHAKFEIWICPGTLNQRCHRNSWVSLDTVKYTAESWLSGVISNIKQRISRLLYRPLQNMNQWSCRGLVCWKINVRKYHEIVSLTRILKS